MKLNKRLVTLGLLILILSVALKFIWTGLKQIKVDDFHPAAVIFVVDHLHLTKSIYLIRKKL